MAATRDFHEDEVLGKAVDLRLLGRLWTFIRPHSGWVAFTTFSLMAVAGLQMVPALVVQRAVDGPLAERLAGTIDDATFASGMTTLLMVFGGALVLTFVLQAAQVIAINLVGQRTMHDLRMAVFRHIQKQPLAFYDRNPVGRLVTRVVHDVESLNQVLTAGVDALFGDVFLLTGIVSVLLWMNWKLTLVTFTLLPLLLFVAHRFRTSNRSAFREVRGRVSRLNAYLQESVTGMRVVQLFSQEERALRGFRRASGDLRDSHLKTVFNYAYFFPAVEILQSASEAIVLWYGAGLLFGPEAVATATGDLTTGEFLAFFILLDRFFAPIRDLSEKYNLMQSAMASSERLFQVLDEEPSIVPPAAPRALPDPASGAVEFDGVTFGYDPARPVLHAVSFRVEPGERVALVGATGAGKTTVTSLLTRLYDVDDGSVRIDGVDVRECDLPELRRRIAVVLQDVFLFAGTIEGNITLGDPGITRERVESAAEAVHADAFIRHLPQGFDTPVLERGATLSVGQKQLLSFARAMARDPAILVLDEATSSVDSETEALVQDAVERLLVGRTAIVVAHRLSTIRSCDRILVFHHGELREQGSHQELLDQGGLYRRLYELQFREQDTAD